MVIASPYLSDPSRPAALWEAMRWIEQVLLGSIATAVAVLCIAAVGLMMLTGRLEIRRGLIVVLGCFVLFGSATIARGFRDAFGGPEYSEEIAGSVGPAPAAIPPPAVRPVSEDPYAGASVIRR